MNNDPEIYRLDALRRVVEGDRAAVLGAVTTTLIAHSQGRTQSPLPMHFLFEVPPGDCHVKAAVMDGAGAPGGFAVKVATTFYDNPKRGLPANNGIVIVLDENTGRVRAVLFDEGWLTAWRTAAVGAVVARALAPPEPQAIGIFGTGHQALMQLDWLRLVTSCRRLLICGRRFEAAERLAATARTLGYEASAVPDAETLLAAARLVVTATAASAPLFSEESVRPGTHITALGADAPGKQELEPELLARANLIAVDDIAQCADHGEIAHGIRAGLLTVHDVSPLGDILAGTSPGRSNPSDITVADLTGIAATDAAVSGLVVSRLG